MKAFSADHSVTWKLSNQWVANIYYMHVRSIVSRLLAYHWRELPQVSFLSWQNFCHNKHVFFWRDKHMFVVTKHVFCHNKSMLVVTKIFCHDKHNFVATNIILSWQKFCHDKHTLAMTKDMFVVTSTFIATKLYLWWQKMGFVATNLHFCLSRQNVCRDKNYTCSSSCQGY